MPYVTLSIGVAMSIPAKWSQVQVTSATALAQQARGSPIKQAQNLLERADHALYAAKAAGRDCVRLDGLASDSRLMAAA